MAELSFFERGGRTTALQPTATGEAARQASFARAGVPLVTTTGTVSAPAPAPEDTSKLIEQAIATIQQLAIAPPPPQEFTQEELGLNIAPEFATEGAIIPVGEKRFRITPTGSLVDITPIADTTPISPTGAPPAIPSPTAISDLIGNTEIERIRVKIAEQSAKISAGIAVGGQVRILTELFERFEIGKETRLINDYNAVILQTQQRLRALPEDIKEGLENIGISEGQLNRLILRESQKPLEVLRDLMEQKGAAAARISQSLKFVALFADATLQDQAAKIEAMKFDFETNKELLESLTDEQVAFAELALDEKSSILELAETAFENGAGETIVNQIQGATSIEEAQSFLAASGFGVSVATRREERLGEEAIAEGTNPLQLTPVQINKGMVASGDVTREQFLSRPIEEQQSFTLGEKSDLIAGRFPVATLQSIKNNITEQAEDLSREELEELISQIPNLPAADELELLIFLDDVAPIKVSLLEGFTGLFKRKTTEE